MIQTHWYAITGAPSSGKTTLINTIADLGYKTAPEIARAYIETQLSKARSLDDIKEDTTQMQRDILAISLKRERHLNEKELIFFDRGTPDSIAYFNYYHIHARKVEQACQHKRYQKVFYCHRLPIVKDNVRVENTQSAKTIGHLLKDAYTNLGYTLIELPATSVQARIDIILRQLKDDVFP